MSKKFFASSSQHKTASIGVGKAGPGKPGEGRHKTGKMKGAGQHPTPGTAQGGKIALNGGMDPGTTVSHTAALSNSRTPSSKRRLGSAFVARMAAAKGAK